MRLPGAHRRTRERPGRFAIIWSAWRGKGAPGIAYITAPTKDEALALERAQEAQIAKAYADARAGMPTLDSVAGLLAAFEAHPEFLKLADSTRTLWSAAIRDMKRSVGRMETIALRARGAAGAIRRWRDGEAKARGAKAADTRLAVLKRALNVCRSEGLVDVNPALGISSTYRSDRSALIWEAPEREAYAAEIRRRRIEAEAIADPINRRRRLESLQAAEDAVEIACWTGMRREDLSVFSRAWLRQGAIVYEPRKSSRRAQTKGHAPRTVIVPVFPALEAVLERRLQGDCPWILTSSKGARYTPGALGHLVADIARAAGVERTLHDCKGTFVTHMLELGMSKQDVADMVDWSVDEVETIAKRYTHAGVIAAAKLARYRARKNGG
jgi:hypothetical protein